LANNNKSKSINQRLGIVASGAQPNYDKKESIDVNRYNEDLLIFDKKVALAIEDTSPFHQKS
jgi:hypothetical protein